MEKSTGVEKVVVIRIDAGSGTYSLREILLTPERNLNFGSFQGCWLFCHLAVLCRVVRISSFEEVLFSTGSKYILIYKQVMKFV